MIALIALTYLEEDGLVLSIGLLVGLLLLAADTAILWKLAQGFGSSDFYLSTVSSVHIHYGCDMCPTDQISSFVPARGRLSI
jgi:hypothetical protein